MLEQQPVVVLVGLGVAIALLLAILIYVMLNFYAARSDRTYMTDNDNGFRRSLPPGKGVLWNPDENIVRGASAPQLAYVAFDSATGQRKMQPLLDKNSGAINLRPQYCCPLPFPATTAEGHRLMVDARVQFSINRDLLRYVYQLDDFGMALETRIQSAIRSVVGKHQNEDLRASMHEAEREIIERLRQLEREGDEAGEQGMALGVNFHTASFTYVEDDGFAHHRPGSPITAAAAEGAAAQQPAAARHVAHGQSVLSLRPQQLDLIADVFKHKDANATRALLSILDMQTRQNIAEALASSGQLVVVTPQDIGLVTANAQRDALARANEAAAAPTPGQPDRTNGFSART